MFIMMNLARFAVGMEGLSISERAYQQALGYAKERIQSRDVAGGGKAVPIIRHPDVRRMLMLQKAFAEGLRAMVLWTAHVQDRIALGEKLEALNDLMLPLVKGYASEKVYELLAVSLQCFGGSGYCQDYPIEQYIRDQKIDSLYEGTTHIQALDLFFRKIGRDQGATLQALLGEIKKTTEGLPAELGVEKAALAKALGDVQGIVAAMLGKLGQSVYHVGLHGNKILFALAELVIGWRLAVSAQVALARAATATGDDVAFYRGKLAASRFYAKTVMPGITLARQLVEQGDLDLMELPDDAW
jgi:hypothetical protein